MNIAIHIRKTRAREQWIKPILLACACISILTTIGIVAILMVETFHFFREVSIIEFFTDRQWTPLFVKKHFGILPLLSGTFLTTLIAMLIAMPLGLLIAIYLSEYATSKARRVLKPVLEILAGVPTIVYGYFALFFVTPMLQKVIPGLAGFNALSPGIVMGIMILPLMTSLSEDAMHAVPKTLRYAGYALGSSRLRVATRVVIPAAFSGITAATIIAISRAIGETMLVAIAAGQMPNLSLNPLKPIMTMTTYIVQVSLGDTPTGTLEYRTIFAVGAVLFALTFCLNITSYRLRRRFAETYE